MHQRRATSGRGWISCAIVFSVAWAVALISPFDRPAAASSPTNASIVVDAASGQVLEQSNADVLTYPASLTKMMTLYILFDALRKGQMTFQQSLPVSANAAGKPSTNLSLSPGDTITVDQAIRALVIRSANDVAVVIAEAMSGSEEAFAQRMNARAQALGMTRTFFRNPNGLPDPLQHTTARDMARLAVALHRDFPQYYAYFSVTRFAYHGRSYFTHNPMVLHYPGADGLKTGYIHNSGFNLVTSATRNDRRLVGVVLGGRSPSQRDAQMWALLDQGFGAKTPKGQNNNALLLAANSAPGVLPALKPEGEGDSYANDPDDDDGATVVTAQMVAPATAPLPAETVTAPVVVPQIRTTEAPAAATQVDMLAPVLAQLQPARRTAIRVASAAPLPTLRPVEPIGVADGVISMAVGGSHMWGIQVGAYNHYSPARQAAIKAQQKLPLQVRNARLAVDETAGRNGKLYRARLIGLAQNEADDACRQLRTKQVSCLVVQSRVSVASTGQ